MMKRGFALSGGWVVALAVLCGSGEGVQPDLLKNSSFEEVDAKGLPADWNLAKYPLPGKEGNVSLVMGWPAHTGERAAQLSFGPELEWAYVSQTCWQLLASGEQYLFSVWLRADKPGRASIALSALGEPPGQGEKTLEMVRREWIDLTTEWKRCSVRTTIDESGRYVRLWCIVQLHAAEVTLSIDDANLAHENPPLAEGTFLHPTHSVGCVRTQTAPVIDGKLDDTCWQGAGIADNFTNLVTMSRPRPSQETKVYLLFDTDNLYVGYRCFESDLSSIKAEKTERDSKGLWGDDCVELFLIPPDSPFHGIAIVSPKYYHLLVNSLGTQGDDVGLTEVDQWDGAWQARTAREENAWTVEMKIPFGDLDCRPMKETPWKVNFTRTEKRLGENSTWAFLETNFHDPARFGNIYFVEEPGDAAVVLAAAVATQASKITEGWRKDLSNTADKIPGFLEPLRTLGREEAADLSQRLARAEEMLKQLLAEGEAMKPREVLDMRERFESKAAAALGDANVLANAADALIRAKREAAFVLLSAPAITNDRILPRSLLSGRGVAKELALAACPGEYESASFVVLPWRDVAGLTVTSSQLESSKGVIDASSIDVKLVKCWYQSFGQSWKLTGGVSYARGKVLLPELLVNDDELVRVDLRERQNLLRVTDPKTGEERYENVTMENESLTQDLVICDADSLRPVDMGAGEARQFWVTVRVGADAPAGIYQGIMTVRCEGSQEAVLPIRLEVYPFRLAPSAVEQSIYYRGQLSGSEKPVIECNMKTEVQYEAELGDMMAHGVDAPLCYQSPGDMELMKRALEIRKQVGVRTDRFFFCALGVGPKDVGENTRRVLEAMMGLTRSFGYMEFYNYGPDEPSVERVRQQVGAWAFEREIGAKVYLACNVLTDTTGALREDIWDAVKGVVDALVVAETPNAQLASAMHEAGLRIYNYANPQCGIEEPLTYRRNCGLLLWKAGYDGAMDYAYQHGFGEHMWNDFDSIGERHNYRDHVMAYATSTGVVDTLQWEGYREGVDDLRYLATLLEKIGEAKKDGERAPLAREIEEWVATIDPSGDLDELRAEIARRIIELSGGR
ncbi:MAG: sugar-binding protein [Planctomycetota bacterium]